MDYINNLIKAHTFLLKKYKELKDNPACNPSLNIQDDESTSDYYRNKYNTVSRENLQLKELVSQYELQIFNFKRNLKEKDKEIERLKKLVRV